ncbi:MAG: EamA family transporter [Alphaproteobacteria bacterium]|nr:EamA family transporter [Alphaproteobacteria bacterium]MBT4966802.1 EamA family transporter [Alphaproteobacteria bacterium]MBT5160167.1 EamA family transporter [Alphaproteobacteria bacterium]MBT6384535.1 EamA family transporter [Alphaproteobacteria bacterium]
MYVATVLVWGSSWLGIQFQYGIVAPGTSVAYRYVLAAAIMVAFCVLTKRKLLWPLRDQIRIAIQGCLLFGINFYLIYHGTQYITSGLGAVLFSTIVIMNIIGNALMFRKSISKRVAAGALMGLVGITTVFWREIQTFDLSSDATTGILLVLAGTLSASLGMLSSALYQRRGLPVIETTTLGMIYGALFSLGATWVLGYEFNFDFSVGYIGSLIYLAVFASVIGFVCYLTLLGKIGADRASYATVVFPLVSLTLSTFFEDFQWTVFTVSGIGFIIVGNVIILTKTKAERAMAKA